jgi:hypothetical protein
LKLEEQVVHTNGVVSWYLLWKLYGDPAFPVYPAGTQALYHVVLRGIFAVSGM